MAIQDGSRASSAAWSTKARRCATLAMVHAGLGFLVLQVLNRALLAQYPVRVITLGKEAPNFDICAVRRTGDVNGRLHQAWTDALRTALVAAKLTIQPN